MATRALSALPPTTFPAPGVAAAIHRAVTAAGADPRPQGVERRATPVLSLDARRARPPPVAEAEPGRSSARDTTVVDPLSRRVDHGAVPSRPRAPPGPAPPRPARLPPRRARAAIARRPVADGCAAPARPEVAGRDPFSLGVAAGEPARTASCSGPGWRPSRSGRSRGAGRADGGRCRPHLRDRRGSRDADDRPVRPGDRGGRPSRTRCTSRCGASPPGRPYWYRFTQRRRPEPHRPRLDRAGARSPARASSASASSPAPTTSTGTSRPTGTSPTNHPDLVLFLGDYIYEYVDRVRPTVRRHSDGVEAATLPTYRNRYAQYRLDPDLQRLHAEVPALVTWDDHEVQNDYADQWSATFDDPGGLPGAAGRRLSGLLRAHAAPAEPVATRKGPRSGCTTASPTGTWWSSRCSTGGSTARREACSRPPNYGGGHFETDAWCPERRDPGRSILGAAQEAWLFDGLARSSARWNILAQDVLMAQLRQRVPLVGTSWATGPMRGTATRPAGPAPPARGGEPRLESRGDRRRPPFLLGQRPEAGLRRSWLADRGDGVRRDVGLARSARPTRSSWAGCPTTRTCASSRAASAATSPWS